MKSPISTIIAVLVGLVVLLGYFLTFMVPAIAGVRDTLIGWAVILAGIATWVGVLNLLSAHFSKVNNQSQNYGYSLVLILAFFVTLAAGLYDGLMGGRVVPQIVQAVQIPVEASLMALLAFVLILAGIRLLRRRRGWPAWVFFASAVVYLIIGSGILSVLDLSWIANLFNSLPVAGARGILLGVGLGSLVTGLRVLIGADRPYGG